MTPLLLLVMKLFDKYGIKEHWLVISIKNLQKHPCTHTTAPVDAIPPIHCLESSKGRLIAIPDANIRNQAMNISVQKFQCFRQSFFGFDNKPKMRDSLIMNPITMER
ncbi:hypothetical protein D3C87_1585190 [compost metagenome]